MRQTVKLTVYYVERWTQQTVKPIYSDSAELLFFNILFMTLQLRHCKEQQEKKNCCKFEKKQSKPSSKIDDSDETENCATFCCICK